MYFFLYVKNMGNTSQIKWIRMLALIPSIAMAMMDQSILPVALPTIQKEFGSNADALQWTVNAYMLIWAIFVLAGGKLADQLGNKRTYLGGMCIFTFFSILCGVSPNTGFLIVSRGLQGVGAAIMFPSQSSLISSSFPSHARGRAIGMMVSIGSVFLVLAPMVGGFLTEHFSWRWIFWINIPLAITGFILAYFLLPASEKQGGKIDLLGLLYFALFAGATTLFFMQANSWGWKSHPVLLLGATALVSLAFLLRREKRAIHPFLELKMFKIPLFAMINVSVMVTQFVLMINVFRTMYTEEILGFSPLKTGLIISASSLPILFFSYLGGFLSDKGSPRLPITIGYLLIIGSFLWLGVNPTPPLPIYLAALTVYGAGIPLVFTPSYSLAMSRLPAKKMGTAMGMISCLRMLSASIGLALIFLFVDTIQLNLRATVGTRLATISSFSAVHFVLSGVMTIAFILSFFLYKKKSAHRLPDAPSDGWD